MFHFIKKKLILSHLTKKKSHLILILTWNRIGPGQKILVLVINLCAVTIKIVLKSAQFNKLRLMKNYYIQKADFSKHTHWQMLTGFHSHAGSHVDNVALPIMLLCWLAGNFISVLSSRSNLELPVKHSVTENLIMFSIFSRYDLLK